MATCTCACAELLLKTTELAGECLGWDFRRQGGSAGSSVPRDGVPVGPVLSRPGRDVGTAVFGSSLVGRLFDVHALSELAPEDGADVRAAAAAAVDGGAKSACCSDA